MVETITKRYSQHWWHDTFDQKKASELMGHSHIVLGFKFDEKKKKHQPNKFYCQSCWTIPWTEDSQDRVFYNEGLIKGIEEIGVATIGQ